MHDSVKKSADVSDVERLKYIFVDALDVDPTFENYREDYEYVKAKGLFEPYRELSGMSECISSWNMEYWKKIKRDFLENFSEMRLMHMREVAKVLYAAKVNRLKSAAAVNPQTISVTLPKEKSLAVSIHNQNQAVLSHNASTPQIGEKQAAVNREVAEAKRRFEKEEKQRIAQRASVRNAEIGRMGGSIPKKSFGGTPTKLIIGVGVGIAILVSIILFRK